MLNNSQTNQILISKIFAAQCHQDFEQATSLLEQLTANIVENLNMFNKHPKIHKILQDNFEIFPEQYLVQTQQMDDGIEQYHKYLEQICNQTSKEEKKTKNKNPWTEEERKLFKQAIKEGQSKDWKAMAQIIKTRSPPQVRSYFQKYMKKKRQKLKSDIKQQ